MRAEKLPAPTVWHAPSKTSRLSVTSRVWRWNSTPFRLRNAEPSKSASSRCFTRSCTASLGRGSPKRAGVARFGRTWDAFWRSSSERLGSRRVLLRTCSPPGSRRRRERKSTTLFGRCGSHAAARGTSSWLAPSPRLIGTSRTSCLAFADARDQLLRDFLAPPGMNVGHSPPSFKGSEPQSLQPRRVSPKKNSPFSPVPSAPRWLGFICSPHPVASLADENPSHGRSNRERRGACPDYRDLSLRVVGRREGWSMPNASTDRRVLSRMAAVGTPVMAGLTRGRPRRVAGEGPCGERPAEGRARWSLETRTPRPG